MEDIVNRTWRKVFSTTLVRHCSNCKKEYKCNGSCGSALRISMKDFCFCSECYGNSVLVGMPGEDARRNCDVYQNYIER